MPNNLSIIILAGGRSARMGRDKAAIEIDGIPLIRRIYDVVASCQDPTAADAAPLSQRIYVITSWAEKYQSMLPVTCHFIPEQQRHQGPLLAFAEGLEQIDSTWLLLLACDMPNLSAPVIQSWIDRLPSISAQSIAYLPKHPFKGWEPLCGFYRQICHHSLREYIDDGGKSFQGWLNLHSVTELAIVDRVCLTNCNTPEELATVVEHRSFDLK